MIYASADMTWTRKTSPYMVAPQWFVDARKQDVPEEEIKHMLKVEIETALRLNAERQAREFSDSEIKDSWIDALYNLYNADYELHTMVVQ